MPRTILILWLLPMLGGCLVSEDMLLRYLDKDGDGERPEEILGSDCDDTNPRVGRGAPEVCGNGIDDDCDGETDEDGVNALTFYVDADGDGYGDRERPFNACTLPDGASSVPSDCNDRREDVSPAAVEDCTDGIDNDCDDVIDEADVPPEWYPDRDGDGWGDDEALPVRTCSPVPDHVTRKGDCDDRETRAHPGQVDVPYDGIDNDCDLETTWEFDQDRDGFPVDPSDPRVTGPYAPPPTTVFDCDDDDAMIHPQAPDAPYDGIDSDCDGQPDDDADRDGHAAISEGGDDCDDTNQDISPSAAEIPYDGVDDDCDPSNDDDADGDGQDAEFRGGIDCDDDDPDVWVSCAGCADRDGDGAHFGCDDYVRRTPDCDDTNPSVWASCATCVDEDGDNAHVGCDAYVQFFEDCDDTVPDVWASCDRCVDLDGDGRWTDCDAYVSRDPDCDDLISNAWSTCGSCVDQDGDGVGTGACDDGPVDCDDTDPDVWASCDSCVDEDGDGFRVGCDATNASARDCDDTDPTVWADHEIPEDGIDQDCDGADLLVDEDHGVFVAEDGVDGHLCGTRAAPCATPWFANRKAAASGRVLFVAEGTYEVFSADVSVYGGFAPTSWQRSGDAGPTTIVDPFSDHHSLGQRCGHCMLDNLHVSIDASRTDTVDAIQLTGYFQGVKDVRVEVVGTTLYCVSVRTEARATNVRGLVADECAASVTYTGVIADRTVGGGHLRVSDARFEAFQASPPEVFTGIAAIGTSVSAHDIEISGEASASALGLSVRRASQGKKPTLHANNLVVRVTGGDNATGLRALATGGVDLDKVRIHADAASAKALWVGIDETSPLQRLLVRDSVLTADATEPFQEVINVFSGVAPTLELVHVSVFGSGSATTAITATGLGLSFRNTVLDTADRAITGADALSAVGLRTTAACLHQPSGGPAVCPLPGASTHGVCNLMTCGTWVNAEVIEDPMWSLGEPWLLPLAGSPLLDAGSDLTAGIHSTTDVDGVVRPQGTAVDLGAYEVAP